MPNDRRDRTPGGSWFFTVCLRDQTSALLTEEVDLLRSCVRQTMSAMPFTIRAWVVLPDHLHAIWTLPDGDNDYPNRWKSIKGRFSRSLPQREVWRPRGKGLWQNRYREHRIRDERDLLLHLAYCHFNPVRHRLVRRPEDWPYSSLHRDILDGRIGGALIGHGSPSDDLPCAFDGGERLEPPVGQDCPTYRSNRFNRLSTVVPSISATPSITP